MGDTLKDLYLGHIRPFERGECQDPDYTATMSVIGRVLEYFKGVLSANDYARLEEFEALCARAAEIAMVDVFKAGYSLATRLLISSITENKRVDGAERLDRQDRDN
jgi:hypothetical protein